ncbi:hypothetical protein DWC19_17600 [Streptomyces sp. M7]|nr:hypothetical protein DWC19_17600 [Streptomyces sp. M7]
MGLERLVMLLQGRDSVYGTDLFEPWARHLPPLWSLDERGTRLVIDHLRSATVVIGDGVRPSAGSRGYVLRRLVRRVLTTLWRDDPSRTLSDLPQEPLRHTLDHFRLPTGPDEVRGVLDEEERRFRDLVRRGRSVLDRPEFSGRLSDDDYRRLHDTYGLPRDLVTGLRAG